MLDVTWEWIAIYEPALDIANTIAVEKGVERDLLAPEGEYQRWAEVAARSPELSAGAAAAVGAAGPRLLELREHIRAVLTEASTGSALPKASVSKLNDASRAAPEWLELDADGQVERQLAGDAVERLLAEYARSAMGIAADGREKLRVCPAPSCGMFYRPRRAQQRWCSEPCGNRARFARHYARVSGAAVLASRP